MEKAKKLLKSTELPTSEIAAQGMPSRPFMYETGLEMRNALDNIIKEVFK